MGLKRSFIKSWLLNIVSTYTNDRLQLLIMNCLYSHKKVGIGPNRDVTLVTICSLTMSQFLYNVACDLN